MFLPTSNVLRLSVSELEARLGRATDRLDATLIFSSLRDHNVAVFFHQNISYIRLGEHKVKGTLLSSTIDEIYSRDAQTRTVPQTAGRPQAFQTPPQARSQPDNGGGVVLLRFWTFFRD